MIIVDCEKMRWKNSGIFNFDKELSHALLSQEYEHNHKLGFYIRKKTKNILGKVPYIYKREWHRYLFWRPQIELWHATFQLKANIPIGVPVVLTIHDLNYLYENSLQKEQETVVRNITKYIKRASHIVTISNYVKEDVLNHFDIEEKPVSVIYNGCNIYTGLIQEPEYKPVRPFLFFIGSMMWKKNIHVLPCLLKDNDYELIIAGTHDKKEADGCMQAIMKEAQIWNTASRVHLVGTISEAEKYWYYKHCSAFLFPSLAEGFGLPVIEAMQFGKPVFLSDRTSLPEIGGKLAYYFNHDFNRNDMICEFNNGMNDFYNNPKKAELIKQHALQFSWANAAKNYWNIYESLLNK